MTATGAMVLCAWLIYTPTDGDVIRNNALDSSNWPAGITSNLEIDVIPMILKMTTGLNLKSS